MLAMMWQMPSNGNVVTDVQCLSYGSILSCISNIMLPTFMPYQLANTACYTSTDTPVPLSTPLKKTVLLLLSGGAKIHQSSRILITFHDATSAITNQHCLLYQLWYFNILLVQILKTSLLLLFKGALIHPFGTTSNTLWHSNYGMTKQPTNYPSHWHGALSDRPRGWAGWPRLLIHTVVKELGQQTPALHNISALVWTNQHCLLSCGKCLVI